MKLIYATLVSPEVCWSQEKRHGHLCIGEQYLTMQMTKALAIFTILLLFLPFIPE